MSLFITFVLIGLWHGANWTYVVFGAIHGVYLVLELLTEKLRKRITSIMHLNALKGLHQMIQTGFVFILVTGSFIFFRSETVTQALSFFTMMFDISNLHTNMYYIIHSLTQFTGKVVFLVLIFSIIVMEIVQYIQEKEKTLYIFDTKPKFVRHAWYYALVSCIIFFGYFGAQSFIYFQF